LGYDGYLYLAGGINLAKSILRSCERFNWESNLWEPVADMKHQRRGFAMVAVPQGLFVIGGHDTVRMLSEVEFYDFGRKEWVECAPMKEARCYHTAVVAKDYQSITVFGGFNNLSDLASIESYSIEGDNWKVKGSMGR
jgi:influenza virus NS1A-binding protein